MPQFYSIPQLMAIASTIEGRREIANWTQDNMRPLESDNAFYNLVKQGGYDLTGAELHHIFDFLKVYSDAGSRGHKVGHHRRDFIHAYLLATDTFRNPQIAPAEALAGFFGGAWHELAVSFLIRYHDNKYCIGHDTAGGWMAYHIFRQYLPEHIALLIAYNITLHSHYMKDIVASVDGDIRKPWNDTIFERNGWKVRVSVWLCRFSDRLDNLGFTQFGRHIEASGDASIHGGTNLRPDGSWENFNAETIKALLLPAFRTSAGNPTTFAHILGYGASAFNGGAYDKYDYLVPTMVQLKYMKMAEIVQLNNALVNGKPVTEAPRIDRLINLLNRIEMEAMDSHQFALISQGWSNLSETEKCQWGPILDVLEVGYQNWLNFLLDAISKTELFPGFDSRVILEV